MGPEVVIVVLMTAYMGEELHIQLGNGRNPRGEPGTTPPTKEQVGEGPTHTTLTKEINNKRSKPSWGPVIVVG